MKCNQLDNLNKSRDCFALRPGDKCEIYKHQLARRCLVYHKGTQFDGKSDKDNAEYVFDGYEGTFRAIPGFDKRYYINELGIIVNRKGKRLYGGIAKGSLYVRLVNPKGGYSIRNVAYLVANMFIPGEGKVVHIDGDIFNNSVDNLKREVKKDGLHT